MAKITARVDRITRLDDDYRSPTPPIPLSVKVELTARCDFQCFFCASAMRLRRKADIDPEFFRRILREMRALGAEEIGLFYLGEPRMATPERVRECMEAGLDSLKFSFNFSDAEQFVQVTNVRKVDFYKVEENLKAARRVRDAAEAATGHRCGLYASSIRYDDEQLTRMEAPRCNASCPTSTNTTLHRGPCHLRRAALGLLLRPRRPLRHGRPQRTELPRRLAQREFSAPALGQPRRGRTWDGVREVHRL